VLLWQFGSGGDRRIPALSEIAWQALGLNEGLLDRLFDETAEEIEKATVFLELAR